MNISSIYHKLKGSKYTPYWLVHAVVAVSISAVGLFLADGKLALSMGGSLFYLGMEIAQYEEKGVFDHKGILYPIIACAILYVFVG